MQTAKVRPLSQDDGGHRWASPPAAQFDRDLLLFCDVAFVDTGIPQRGGFLVRSHWGIENRLHWRLDVVMDEDQDRNRMDNSPYNLAILRHMAMNVFQKEGSKGSLRGKFRRAGWDDTFLRRFLAAF